MDWNNATIAVIGLGYVGLPLAVEFARQRNVVAFDIKADRIAELEAGADSTLEVPANELAEVADRISYTADAEALRDCAIFIVTVPTPIDHAKRPDFTPLIKASETVGKVMGKDALVIYESTVYPGATEEVCVPVLEQHSGLTYNRDFYCGYSPERINPGDTAHRLPTIVKVTSGSTPEVAQHVDALYRQIITAGTHLASSIAVAEAAKVIENTQRDVNIALMNELSVIFSRLQIDTLEVLAAAGTKWNFLPFKPGLVGGHCIGVDPYYLTHKAQEVGYHPEVVLAGRRINDGMGEYVADQTVKLMLQHGNAVLGGRVLVLGLTFKENCPDLRNTRVVDVVRALKAYRLSVDAYDPWVTPQEAEREYGFGSLDTMPAETGQYDGIVVAVGHRQFVELGAERLRALGKPGAIIYDIKGILPRGAAEGRL
ncbi:MAG: nucleotide sugar dehydrogenase [Pseudomonadota bacterium]